MLQSFNGLREDEIPGRTVEGKRVRVRGSLDPIEAGTHSLKIGGVHMQAVAHLVVPTRCHSQPAAQHLLNGGELHEVVWHSAENVITSNHLHPFRSEERRVGKECRS